MIDAIKGLGGLNLTSPLEGPNAIGGGMGIGASAQSGATQGPSFADVMANMATDATDALKAAETKSFEGIRGTANTREVVDAMMSAEQSLHTVTAVRDKVVSAYLEIVRMQI